MTEFKHSIPSGIPVYWDQAKQCLKDSDLVLRRVIEHFESFDDTPLKSRGDLFYTLANAIVGQQISAVAAAAIWGRFVAYLSGTVGYQSVLISSPAELKDLGLSTRKVEYLQGVASSMPKLLEFPWSSMTDEEVRETLCTLRGVGPWTAEMVLIFTLMRPNILPLGDIGVIRAVEKCYAQGQKLSKDEVSKIAEKWQPYRTVAVWYLWRTIDTEPVEY
jgi:DNA-3-methyladenine glycosylase II